MSIPYQDLYIYEISGEVTDSRLFFQKDFIGCWNEGEMSCLFFSAPHDDEVHTFIRKKGLRLLSTNVMDYGSWQAGEELRPFKMGNLVFSPPWETRQVEEGEILVSLDPCVVFGTGHHPTTRSCLKGLSEIYQRGSPKRVLDLGTGSGVLALAAAKWGAERILAVDCNELAVDTARRNVLLNKEFDRIEVVLGKAEDFIEEEADLLCANLHLQVLETLAHKEKFFQKEWFVLSGLFIRDGEQMEQALNRRSIQTFLKLQERNWLTLVGRREPSKFD